MSLLNSYVSLNVLIIAAYFIFKFLKINPTFKIQLQYFTLGLFAIIICFSPFFPKSDFTNNTVKVWSANSVDDISNENISTPTIQFTNQTKVQIPKGLPLYVQFFSLLTLSLFFIRLLKEVFTLRKISKESYVFK